MCLICLCSVCFIVPAVVLIIRGEGAERGGGVKNCLLGIADFGIADFGIADFGIADLGIAYFEIAYFGIAYFGTKESDCLLCGRLAYFEYKFILVK
jgi:hypothetical protein